MILAAVVSLTLAQTEIREARVALARGSNIAARDHCLVALDLGAPKETVAEILKEAMRRMMESAGKKDTA